jgi:Transglutaminase-like superfamily
MRMSVADLRAASWTLRAVVTARHQLRTRALRDVRLPRPPAVDDPAVRAVHAVLRRKPASCLERALVLQCWHSAHGRPQDVVIGIAGVRSEFRAHAWLGENPQEGTGFRELARVAPR